MHHVHSFGRERPSCLVICGWCQADSLLMKHNHGSGSFLGKTVNTPQLVTDYQNILFLQGLQSSSLIYRKEGFWVRAWEISGRCSDHKWESMAILLFCKIIMAQIKKQGSHLFISLSWQGSNRKKVGQFLEVAKGYWTMWHQTWERSQVGYTINSILLAYFYHLQYWSEYNQQHLFMFDTGTLPMEWVILRIQ